MRFARAVAGCLAISAGCGRLDFEPRDALVDAPESPSPDASVCVPGAPFGTPHLIPELSDPAANDGTLRLLPDERSGYFWSYRGSTNADIFYVSRSAIDQPFSISLIAGGLNTTANELDPTLSSDGTTFVFRRNLPGDDLYVATPTAPDAFGAATAIGTINQASTETQSFMPVGRDELYFESNRSGGGDIYVSTRTGTTFGAPTAVGGVSSTLEDGDPAVTSDGLTIYFRSNRPAANAGFNIHVATRTTTSVAFSNVQLVPNVNTDGDEGPSWISPDDCRLYLSSDVAGTNDIYVATRGVQ